MSEVYASSGITVTQLTMNLVPNSTFLCDFGHLWQTPQGPWIDTTNAMSTKDLQLLAGSAGIYNINTQVVTYNIYENEIVDGFYVEMQEKKKQYFIEHWNN